MNPATVLFDVNFSAFRFFTSTPGARENAIAIKISVQRFFGFFRKVTAQNCKISPNVVYRKAEILEPFTPDYANRPQSDIQPNNREFQRF